MLEIVLLHGRPIKSVGRIRTLVDGNNLPSQLGIRLRHGRDVCTGQRIPFPAQTGRTMEW